MSLTIHQMEHSPFCIPITAALRACDAECETREVPNWDRSEIIRLTGGAYYQVPVLVHDKRVVFESGGDTQDVARYVDATFARGALFPPRLDGLQAIVIDFMENDLEARTFKLVDPSYLDAMDDAVARTMVVRHEERRFGRGCIEQWRRDAAAIRAEADALLERFESTLRHSAFLLGDAPVYADFLLFGILGNLIFREYKALSAEQRALAGWRDRMWTVRL